MPGKVGSLQTDLGSSHPSNRLALTANTNLSNQNRATNTNLPFYAVSPVYQVDHYQKQMAILHTHSGSPSGQIIFETRLGGLSAHRGLAIPVV